MKIFGHKKILNFLDRSIEKDNIANAYLFSGLEHLGKFTVALDFAKKLTGGTGQSINPDIFILAPEEEEKNGIKRKRQIKIEGVRELQKELSLAPYFGKRKTAIIDGANMLTVSAQNALLKVLEEPDEKCVLILISHDRDRILPTVRSRCIEKKFNPVSLNEIRMMAAERENGGEDAVFWSRGCPGEAILLAADAEELRKKRERRMGIMQLAGTELASRFALAESMSKDPDGLVETLNDWTMLFRENILTSGDYLRGSFTLEKSLAFLDRIEKSRNLIKDTNANVKLVAENLLLNL